MKWMIVEIDNGVERLMTPHVYTDKEIADTDCEILRSVNFDLWYYVTEIKEKA